MRHVRDVFTCVWAVAVAFPCLGQVAQADELSELKAQVHVMQKQMEVTRKRIVELETTDIAGRGKEPTSLSKKETWQPLSSKRFVRLIYFLDTREFTTFKPFYGFPLPGNMHFFGFTNINSSEEASNHFELTGFFTEARLTSPLWHGVGLQTELNASTGADNDLLRVGALYKRTFKPHDQDWTLIGRVFPVETDGDGGQVSCLYNLQLYKDVLMLDGTVDYNWRSARDTWVVEPLLSVKLYKNLRLAIEYRLNNGRGSRRSGVAFGLESTVAF